MATLNEKEIKTRWPVEQGLVAGTTKQRNENKFLNTGVTSLVACKDKIGI